jgi:prolyl-tRNA synthetase
MTLFPQTRRAMAADTEQFSPGYALMEQAGYVRPAGSSGIYSLLQLGWKSHQKICSVIYEEMEREGVLNVQLPILQSRALWERTERWGKYMEDQTMFVTEEKHGGGEFGLAPTAEEMVTALVAADLRSWRELPLSIHQIGPKFRDEVRPRSGLLRTREFVMSDAYSFDLDEEGMVASFELFRQIYIRIFERLGLEDVLAVQADSGAIGGNGSAEFMVVSEVGEDTLLVCERCGYGANVEKAESRIPLGVTPEDEPAAMSRVPTPGVTSVEELAQRFPAVPATQMVKTLIFENRSAEPDEDLVAVCIRGDLEVNEVKLEGVLGGTAEPASPERIERETGARVGFAGPIDLRGVTRILYDRSVEGVRGFLCGVNQSDVHALDVCFGRDLPAPESFVSVHSAKEGHGCPQCDAALREERGIEIGHVFQLQQRYAEKMGATFTTKEGEEGTPWMGCYGIGTTRLLQAIAEHTRDGDGLRWPAAVSPYDVSLVLATAPAPHSEALIADAAAVLREAGYSVLVDDRSGKIGAKFKDADLLGFPVRVVVGRDADEGVLEVRGRGESETVATGLAELPATVGSYLGGTSPMLV